MHSYVVKYTRRWSLHLRHQCPSSTLQSSYQSKLAMWRYLSIRLKFFAACIKDIQKNLLIVMEIMYSRLWKTNHELSEKQKNAIESLKNGLAPMVVHPNCWVYFKWQKMVNEYNCHLSVTSWNNPTFPQGLMQLSSWVYVSKHPPPQHPLLHSPRPRFIHSTKYSIHYKNASFFLIKIDMGGWYLLVFWVAD